MSDEENHLDPPQSPFSTSVMEEDREVDTSEAPSVTITISHLRKEFTFQFPEDATITDLLLEIESTLNIPFDNQKIMVPKAPLIKAPLKDPDMSLQVLQGKKLMLMGSTTKAVEDVQATIDRASVVHRARMAQLSKARRPVTTAVEDSQYTFLQVRPLAGLPNPERSQALLLRLKQDPGIKAAMKKHKFTVHLLTEMEPLANTQSTHEGTTRLLGLNRNQGEAIELRLRTDAHDGYRDYKTIRNTLCHELAHNVHGPHDRAFWDLCHQIEREVQAADWKSGGRTIGTTSHYTISGEEDHVDEGGWTGGEFVLGGVRDLTAGMSRREVLAKAAEERKRREAAAAELALKKLMKGRDDDEDVD
ncbi:Fc.00g009380.m01.CDS01 [Cosmosporella sp. VM-42]